MKQANTHITLLLGPPTRLAQALNDVVRTLSDFIAAAGVTAIPNRIATGALRAAVAESLSDSERRAALESVLASKEGNPKFLAAINILGGPMEAYRQKELFPNAEQLIADRTSLISPMVSRVVVTIEPLHHFLFSINSPKLHKRLAETSWEALYEISWADLVLEVCEAFPSSSVLVVTPDAVFSSAETVLSKLFGPAGCEIDPALLQRPHLTTAGHAALASVLEAHKPAPEISEQLLACNLDTPAGQATFASILAAHKPIPDILEQLLASHRDTPDPAELEMRLGIDKLTSSLLDERFLEDLREVEALPDVQLLR